MAEKEVAAAEKWMRLALREAEDALNRREVPVGCVFVAHVGDLIEVVAMAGNEVNECGNATRHAEMVAMDDLHEKLKKGPVAGLRSFEELMAKCQLVVTCEPCVMCAAALAKAKVAKVVFGCANDKFGGCGSVFSVLGDEIPVESGVLSDEAVSLFRKFYDRENPQSKTNLNSIYTP